MKALVLRQHLALLVIAIFAVAGTVPLATFAKSALRAQPGASGPQVLQVCPAPAPLHARCFAFRLARTSPSPNALVGYRPSDLRSAYKLPSTTAGSGQTVAIVDSYDDPRAEADLKVYRSTFGIAPCTTANGCFKKVNQRGGKTYPPADTGWAQEISLDLDMVSAICPNCHIVLVEADDSSLSNLAIAVNEAVALGANGVSNSYGAPEFSGETGFASDYNHPGHVITASAGDGGFGTAVPADFNTVTSVGGTTLKRASNTRGWSETVWSGTGSGCSAFIPKPSWQKDSGCARRTMNDVAADADPGTGVAVYDTYSEPGWLVFGGTSVSAPLIAAVYALAGNARSVISGSYPYSHRTSLYDITSGSNSACGGSYLCTAKVGYDGPTGLGTPHGAGAF